MKLLEQNAMIIYDLTEADIRNKETAITGATGINGLDNIKSLIYL